MELRLHSDRICPVVTKQRTPGGQSHALSASGVSNLWKMFLCFPSSRVMNGIKNRLSQVSSAPRKTLSSFLALQKVVSVHQGMALSQEKQLVGVRFRSTYQ